MQENEPRSYLCKFIHDYGLQHSLNYITETNLSMLKPGDYSANEMFRLIVKALITEVYLFVQGFFFVYCILALGLLESQMYCTDVTCNSLNRHCTKNKIFH